jgi:LexA-binding, inner membrane-associated putative hydrolase
MTQVGHAITGAAIGVLCLPPHLSKRAAGGYLVAFALLANVPDFGFRNWGHDRYDISHSVFVNLLIILVVIAGLWWLPGVRMRIGGGTVFLGGAASWLSHLLLDSFYNHGLGVAIFWPFSAARLALPIPWFSVLSSPLPITWQAVQVWAIELASYLPLLLLAVGLRRAGIRDK